VGTGSKPLDGQQVRTLASTIWVETCTHLSWFGTHFCGLGSTARSSYISPFLRLVGEVYKQISSSQHLQQVVFNYTAYNESGATIDSTYRKDRPAETRLGIGGMIPGFEEGIKSMRNGGKRRIVVPPELGPPVREARGGRTWLRSLTTSGLLVPPCSRRHEPRYQVVTGWYQRHCRWRRQGSEGRVRWAAGGAQHVLQFAAVRGV
jgi:hypothetical protein